MKDSREQESKWASKKFGIPADEVLCYHSGSCYDRVVVSTKSAARKVSKIASLGTVNGGWYHGMQLGSITPTPEGFEVIC